MQEQNYQNHGRMVTGFHYVLGSILLFTLVCSIIFFYKELQAGPRQDLLESSLFLLLTICVFMLAWYARVFALKAQDRAIRAEENFRHYLLAGKPLDSSLKMGQIVALRFASDAEFVALAQKTVAENLGAKDIKQQIQSWKADHNRA